MVSGGPAVNDFLSFGEWVLCCRQMIRWRWRFDYFE
jgi:hypothetical protein